MAPYVEDIGEIRIRIDQALATGNIDDWQRQFLISIRRKIERYGRKTRLSGKQINKLREVIEMPVLASTGVGPWAQQVLYMPRGQRLSKPEPASPAMNQPTSRVRQNVIFELGYFAGALGRGRVCLLRKGDVEIPSDLYGVVYTEVDAADGWKGRLVQELKAAKLC
jgi:hypothetical protein